MGAPTERIRQLAQKWLSGVITEDERREFMAWYNEADDKNPLSLPGDFVTDEISHSERIFEAIYKNISAAEPVKRKSFVERLWVRYAAAVVILVGSGIFLYQMAGREKTQVVTKQQPVNPVNDVKPPASTHAFITLGDGRSIVLDSVQNGGISVAGKVEFRKVEAGHIVYSSSTERVSYNTLTNPRGSEVVQVTLSDGTTVWLNSESSIRYPTSFVGAERVVEVTGETYFEVAKNATKPFRVKKKDIEVLVLGTHFNVNAYDEEQNIKVTLLEGSVTVMNSEKERAQLSPGEQTQIDRSGEIKVLKHVDTDGVMAWVNGKFDFGEKTDLQTIMRQLARWYNLEVEYQGNFNQHFGGSISRYVDLSHVLKILQAGGVNFRIEGNKVTVLP